jgi:toxin FitB
MYLLDTDVVAALRKAKAQPAEAGLPGWARSVPRDQLFVSALTLVELEAACRQPRDKAAVARLQQWLDEQVVPAFEGRILAVDLAVTRRRRGVALADDRDALLAATGLEHGLTLATRRGGAYKAGRVRLVDPWAYTPQDDLDWREAARAGGPQWIKNLFVRG